MSQFQIPTAITSSDIDAIASQPTTRMAITVRIPATSTRETPIPVRIAAADQRPAPAYHIVADDMEKVTEDYFEMLMAIGDAYLRSEESEEARQ